MQRLRLEFSSQAGPTAPRHCFDVPDMATALLVADINLERGFAEVLDGDKRLARLEKRGEAGRTYWQVQ